MKIKNHKKKPISLSNFKKYYFFRKYNYMSKIFPKIYFNFEKKFFHSITFRVLLLCFPQTNE